MGFLISSPYKIKIIGDKSLSRRDFNRIAEPLKKFGTNIRLTGKGLPLTIKGNENPLPINYLENKGSAQVKSSIILAGLKTDGKTFIKAKPSRNHTELLCKYLKLPLKVIKRKNYHLIEAITSSDINKFLAVDIPLANDEKSTHLMLILLSPLTWIFLLYGLILLSTDINFDIDFN